MSSGVTLPVKEWLPALTSKPCIVVQTQVVSISMAWINLPDNIEIKLAKY